MKTEELIRYYKANIEAIEKGLNNDSLSADKKFRLGLLFIFHYLCQDFVNLILSKLVLDLTSPRQTVKPDGGFHYFNR